MRPPTKNPKCCRSRRRRAALALRRAAARLRRTRLTDQPVKIEREADAHTRAIISHAADLLVGIAEFLEDLK